MPGRITLDKLPVIPPKKITPSIRVTKTAEELKNKFERGEVLSDHQRGWLADYDSKHGSGKLKTVLYEELIKTETSRKMVEIEKTLPAPSSPEAEASRAEGARLDYVLANMTEIQREATSFLRAGMISVKEQLESLRQEREEIRGERQEMREFQRSLFMDQRSLLELVFSQLSTSHTMAQDALQTLQDGVRAKAEAEAMLITTDAQIQAQGASLDGKASSARGKLEDMVLAAIGDKMGLAPSKEAVEKES